MEAREGQRGERKSRNIELDCRRLMMGGRGKGRKMWEGKNRKGSIYIKGEEERRESRNGSG